MTARKDKMSMHLRTTRDNLLKVPGVHQNDIVTINNAISWITTVEGYPRNSGGDRYRPLRREII